MKPRWTAEEEIWRSDAIENFNVCVWLRKFSLFLFLGGGGKVRDSIRCPCWVRPLSSMLWSGRELPRTHICPLSTIVWFASRLVTWKLSHVSQVLCNTAVTCHSHTHTHTHTHSLSLSLSLSHCSPRAPRWHSRKSRRTRTGPWSWSWSSAPRRTDSTRRSRWDPTSSTSPRNSPTELNSACTDGLSNWQFKPLLVTFCDLHVCSRNLCASDYKTDVPPHFSWRERPFLLASRSGAKNSCLSANESVHLVCCQKESTCPRIALETLFVTEEIRRTLVCESASQHVWATKLLDEPQDRSTSLPVFFAKFLSIVKNAGWFGWFAWSALFILQRKWSLYIHTEHLLFWSVAELIVSAVSDWHQTRVNSLQPPPPLCRRNFPSKGVGRNSLHPPPP